MSFSPLSSQMVVFVQMSALLYNVLVYLNLTSLILVSSSSGWKFPYLTLQNSFAPYTARLTQLTMNFYLTIYLRQLTQLLFNLHALKSPSLVISVSTIRTGLPTLHISLALLVEMQRPLPLWMTCQNWDQNQHVSLIAQGKKLKHSICFLHQTQTFTLTLF